MTNKTMFGSAKYEYLSNMVSLRNPAAARGSIRELEREFQEAKTHTKKLRIARATRLAANRADASRKRKGLSVREYDEFAVIARIYAGAATKMFVRLPRA